MRSSSWPSALLTVCSDVHAQGHPSLPSQLLGPMVGHVTPDEAIIWLYTGGKGEIVVQFRAASDPPDRVQAVRPQPNPAEHNAVKRG